MLSLISFHFFKVCLFHILSQTIISNLFWNPVNQRGGVPPLSPSPEAERLISFAGRTRFIDVLFQMIFIAHTPSLTWQNLQCARFLGINVNFISSWISTTHFTVFAFLRWTVVVFLICLCVYLLWIDSNVLNLNTPVIPTSTVPNKISQSLTIKYPTSHSTQPTQ